MPFYKSEEIIVPATTMPITVNSSMRYVNCCSTLGCRHNGVVDVAAEAVKLQCTGEQCRESTWMHVDCFHLWENYVLETALGGVNNLRNLGAPDRERFDTTLRACLCRCGRGYLRRDGNYTPYQSTPIDSASMAGTNSKMRPFMPSGDRNFAFTPLPIQIITTQSHARSANIGMPTLRKISGGSNWSEHSGSPSEASSDTDSSGSASPTDVRHHSTFTQQGGFDFFADPEQAALGNIFKRRADYSIFLTLPRFLQNPYNVKMEDDGPHGNDETRSFVLTSLTTHHTTEVTCVVCRCVMPVYDKYPLIDGSFFLSPENYRSPDDGGSDRHLKVVHQGHCSPVYLNAVCMACMEGATRELRCVGCRAPWSGAFLMIGSMYAYDIFAAVPCCEVRLRCKRCQHPTLDPSSTFEFFSEYSRKTVCPHCRADDYHFVKPLDQIYDVIEKRPIRKN